MTGLNLETFLQLLRVAPGAWASLGVAVVILALMTWTSWGSRRVLRKCLFLSIAAHLVLIFYGGTSPEVQRFFRLGSIPPKTVPAIDRIKVIAVPEPAPADRDPKQVGQSNARPVSAWDRDHGILAMAETPRLLPRPDLAEPSAPPVPEPPRPAEPVAPPIAAPELGSIAPSATESPTRQTEPVAAFVAEPVMAAVPLGDEIAPSAANPEPAIESAPTRTATVAGSDLRGRSRPPIAVSELPSRTTPALVSVGPAPALPNATPTAAPERDLIPPVNPSPVDSLAFDPGRFLAAAPVEPIAPSLPLDDPVTIPTPNPVPEPVMAPTLGLLEGADNQRSLRPGRPALGTNPTLAPIRSPALVRSGTDVGSLAQVTPSIASALPTLPRAIGRRSLAEVPPVYRSRLDPNRTTLAQRSGASLASERAVERALEWLANHQDTDGRWDGGTIKFRDGHVAADDDTFTVHCPPGDICFGECYYGEADTALTGLSLLAYLGAGYTHVDGKYADVVGRGINFLRQSQKADGDLRGASLNVGMYCHAMATLALCEAYALTGDPTLRLPVERGVSFLVASRAVDGMAWRYSPGAASGDTSILGWVVMVLKSAKTVGIPIAQTIQSGIVSWLKLIASGRSGGLAQYLPGGAAKVTPTMTAEAWACRQFLELGGPGPASDEAAASLLANPTDRGAFNVYYLYYGTLAMYQHGGAAWTAWNARVRDQVVSLQQTSGHKAGSWDPDSSPYGTHGGRIYCTALATLTLEVYYRFLRLYAPPEANPPLAPRPTDNAARRAGMNPPRSPGGR